MSRSPGGGSPRAPGITLPPLGVPIPRGTVTSRALGTIQRGPRPQRMHTPQVVPGGCEHVPRPNFPHGVPCPQQAPAWHLGVGAGMKRSPRRGSSFGLTWGSVGVGAWVDTAGEATGADSAGSPALPRTGTIAIIRTRNVPTPAANRRCVIWISSTPGPATMVDPVGEQLTPAGGGGHILIALWGRARPASAQHQQEELQLLRQGLTLLAQHSRLPPHSG